MNFTDDAGEEIAQTAFLMNEQSENIGARRLHTVMENLLEELSFNISDMDVKELTKDAEYVREKLKDYSRINEGEKYII